jgi:hypothetical protein
MFFFFILIKYPFSVKGYLNVNNLTGIVSFSPSSIFNPIDLGLTKGEILLETKTVTISSRVGFS